jgi:uncharacterized oligopeptide transporter (OPT) family protein
MTSNTENPGFTLRAVLIAIALSLFLLMSTSYIAIRLGAAPWPIIFSVIVSAALIKILNQGRKINIHEVNVAQAGGSIGGLVAAGVTFTIPGIIYLNQTKGMSIEMPEPLLLGLLIAAAGVLGLLLSVPLKYTFIDEEDLPFPAGTAGAELLKLGKTGGKELFLILIIGSIIGIFTLIRDIYIPTGIVLFTLSAAGIILILLPLPIAIGGGYILGPRPGFSWLAGAVVGWFIFIPILRFNGTGMELAEDITKNFGMGMVLGSGVSFFLTYVLPRFRQIFMPIVKTGKHIKKMIPLIFIGGLLGLLLNDTPFVATLFALAGVWAMVAVAARMTGETNIDPLEQFGIFVTLIIALVYEVWFFSLPLYTLFILAAFVSVACAVAGDAGHDYKSAAIIGTRFSDIVKVDFITVIISGLAAPFVFEIIRDGFADQLFTAMMPAPQARMVAGSIIGFEHPVFFITGFTIAFLAEIVNNYLPLKYKNRLLWMPFGIGLFLGPGLAIPIAIGAIIHLWVNRKHPTFYHAGILIAAGIMGAEGIAGFTAGALTISGLSFTQSSLILVIFFIIIFFTGCGLYLYNRKKLEN